MRVDVVNEAAAAQLQNLINSINYKSSVRKFALTLPILRRSYGVCPLL